MAEHILLLKYILRHNYHWFYYKHESKHNKYRAMQKTLLLFCLF